MDDEGLFATAPKAVVDYFDRRPSIPTFDYRDFAPREHAIGYTVAKTSGFNVIEDLRAASRAAAVDRIPFEEFRDRLVPTLQAKGWWGRGLAWDDRRGEYRIAQLGSLRRLRTIYQANVMSAYAAGEWARIQETKDFLPFLRYVTSVSERKRPEHLSWVGTTLPADDPWWSTHFPPNGWNCKCRVEQISGPEARRAPRDKQVAPPRDEQPWRNRRTGETEQIPAGIDPGWQHNPGVMRDRTVSINLQQTIDRMPESARRAVVQDLAQSPLARGVVEGKLGRDNHVPVAVIPQSIGDAVGAKTSVVKMSGEIGLKARRVGRSGRVHHPESTIESYAMVQRAVDAGAIVRVGHRELRFELPDEDGLVWRAAVRMSRDGRELFLSTWFKLDEPRVLRERIAIRGRDIEILRDEVEGE